MNKEDGPFGGDFNKSNKKIDLELGIINKDGKPLDYIGIGDSLKEDNARKIVADPFSYSSGGYSSMDSSQRTSTVALNR